jgi:MFS transporter, PHS family, inorganic phosphate transporter
MEVSLLSFMSICAGADWDLSDYQMALITSVVFIGQLFGSAIFGPVADDYGRHKAFAISSIMISVGGVLSGFSPNFLWLIFFRGLVGFGVGKSKNPISSHLR